MGEGSRRPPRKGNAPSPPLSTIHLTGITPEAAVAVVNGVLDLSVTFVRSARPVDLATGLTKHFQF